jgi:hypothetical protein
MALCAYGRLKHIPALSPCQDIQVRGSTDSKQQQLVQQQQQQLGAAAAAAAAAIAFLSLR